MTSRLGWRLALAAALAGSVYAAYHAVSGFPFLRYDDNLYVTENPWVAAGLTRDGVAWAFTRIHAGNWHPLTWMSHMLDCQLFGMDPAGHHLVNVGFHALNACLFFLFLTLTTGSLWRSGLAAAFFALHPLRVESVAWISERKDVLSGFFALLTLLLYARWSSRRSRLAYVTALVAFALGLGAKPMLVTLPFALLLADLWPLQRLHGPWRWDRTTRRLVLEKLPFFALSGASIAMTLTAQSSGIHGSLSWGLRVSGSLAAYRNYLAATFWPSDLAAMYPRPLEWDPLLDLATVGALAAVTALGIAQIQRRPYLISGWLWFLGVLTPTLGLVAVGAQGWADRYTYLPSLGLSWALVWAASDLLERAPRQRWIAATVGLALIAGGIVATRAQAQTWRSHRTLFEHALAVTDDNYFAHTEVGIALRSESQLQPAVEHLRKAIAIDPTYAYAQGNLGLSLLLMGDPSGAIPHFERTAELAPTHRDLHRYRGIAFEATERSDDAIEAYRAQLELNPSDRDALLLLARLLITHPDPARRDPAEAKSLLKQACRRAGCQESEIQPLVSAILQAAREYEEALPESR